MLLCLSDANKPIARSELTKAYKKSYCRFLMEMRIRHNAESVIKITKFIIDDR